MIVLLRKKFLARAAALLCILIAFGTVSSRRALPVFSQHPAACEKTIVIDAGHGGEDGGAVAADGTVESTINLAIARDVEALLRFLGCRTVMTRTEDTAIYSPEAETLREKKASDLKNRVSLVNGTPNAILLSIHQNSLPSSTRVHGAQAFYAQTPGSGELAAAIQTALNAAINPGEEKNCRSIDPTVYLMKHVTVPAVLVECGFLSNAEETARLCREDHQRRLAAAITAGLLSGLAAQTTGEGSAP